MGCASCGGGRSRSGMGGQAILRNRPMSRYARRGVVMPNPQVVNVEPTVSGVVIPPNAMSENPATGVIPPQVLNVKPLELEVAGENETAAQEAKGE